MAQISFLTGTNSAFIAELYAHYLDDPASVDASWRGLFEGLKDDSAGILAELHGPAWARTPPARIIGNGAEAKAKPGTQQAQAAYAGLPRESSKAAGDDAAIAD